MVVCQPDSPQPGASSKQSARHSLMWSTGTRELTGCFFTHPLCAVRQVLSQLSNISTERGTSVPHPFFPNISLGIDTSFDSRLRTFCSFADPMHWPRRSDFLWHRSDSRH